MIEEGDAFFAMRRHKDCLVAPSHLLQQDCKEGSWSYETVRCRWSYETVLMATPHMFLDQFRLTLGGKANFSILVPGIPFWRTPACVPAQQDGAVIGQITACVIARLVMLSHMLDGRNALGSAVRSQIAALVATDINMSANVLQPTDSCKALSVQANCRPAALLESFFLYRTIFLQCQPL